MPPRKSTATKTLDTTGAKIGEPVPKAIIDTNTASVGVPRQAESDLQEDLSALRKQIDALQQRVANAAQSAKGNAGDAMRQTQAAVKRHPVDIGRGGGCMWRVSAYLHRTSCRAAAALSLSAGTGRIARVL